jgi:hypothetical protein
MVLRNCPEGAQPLRDNSEDHKKQPNISKQIYVKQLLQSHYTHSLLIKIKMCPKHWY